HLLERPRVDLAAHLADVDQRPVDIPQDEGGWGHAGDRLTARQRRRPAAGLVRGVVDDDRHADTCSGRRGPGISTSATPTAATRTAPRRHHQTPTSTASPGPVA